MPRKKASRDVTDAVRFERQANAAEVAETLITLFGGADAGETVLEQALQKRKDPDREFWQEVITALTQIRG